MMLIQLVVKVVHQFYRNYSETGQTAIAIHAYGASGSPLTNKGTRITQAVFDNISKWEEE